VVTAYDVARAAGLSIAACPAPSTGGSQVNSSAAARPWGLMAALAAFMIIPIVLLVAFGQRRIIEGLTAGANK